MPVRSVRYRARRGLYECSTLGDNNMKRLLLAGVALSVATAASAADMQARPYAKAPPAVVSPAYNWSGFYIGVMGGWWLGHQFGQRCLRRRHGRLQLANPRQPVRVRCRSRRRRRQHQGQRNRRHRRRNPAHDGKQDQRIRQRDRPGRLRDGCGAALRQGRLCVGQQQGHDFSARPSTSSDSQTHSGYTLGGGVEYMFAPSWSAKGEYMYTSLGSETLQSGRRSRWLPARIDFHTIKVGVNYRFR